MEELRKQVTRAHRRLSLQRFFRVWIWSLFVCFVIATLAIAVPKIWPIGLDSQIWMWSWMGGAAAAATLFAMLGAYATRRTPLEAAIEIDRRFGLKERVSSTFALSPTELSSQVGEALVKDASRRVARLDVSEQFRFRGNWTNCLPFAAAVLAFVVAVFVPDAVTQPTQTNAASLDVKKQIKNSTEELKKKWAEQRKKAEEKDLEAAKLFSELEKGVGDLNKLNDVDKKKAMVKLNDLKEEINKRRKQIGDLNKLQKQLNQLKNLKPGPAKEMAKALRQGDFNKAISELNDIKNQLAQGKMSDKDRQALSDQLQQMADKMQQKVDAREMAKKSLKEQIEQAQKEGDNSKAGELQRKLDQLNAQNAPMKQMQKMAQKMSQAANNAKANSAEAADQMAALAEDLEAIKQDLEEMGMLDEAMEQLADAKDAMNCQECNGMGCEQCMGMGGRMGRIPGQGMGEGQGQGDRPEAETDKNFYDSQVRGKVGKGKAVVVGLASGKNMPGEALEEIKEAMEATGSDSSDALTNVRLPKEHQDHAREYFESFDPGR